MENLSWKERYDRMKKGMNYTDADIARITGMGEKTVNVMIRREPFPRWVRLAIVLFEGRNGLTDHD